MNDTFVTMEQKRDLLKSFLIIPRNYEKNLHDNDVIWIYKIINIQNSKVYIGKTNDLIQRGLNYINSYLKGDNGRKITKAIDHYGISSFIMSPLEIAKNEKSAEIKEKYYIDLYDSINNGYNTTMNSAPSYNNRSRKSVPQTLYAKMVKSKLVCAINLDEREMIFSTGLKLFGDLIGRSKDEVKSAAKREMKLNGYFIYYLNHTDFEKQVDHAHTKLHKNRNLKDNKLQYSSFLIYAMYLQNFLKNNYMNNESFDLKFIIQSNSESGYEFRDIEDFYKFYSNASFEKIDDVQIYI